MTPFLLLAAAPLCITVPSAAGRITAGDLAGSVPAFAAAAPETPLGYAPSPGARRILTAAELSRVLARLALSGTVAADVCVERASSPPDAARLLAAMQRALPDARIEMRDYSRYATPEGEIEFPLPGLQRSGLWNGWVRYGQDRRFRIWARVEATVTREEVVAVETLSPHRPIAADQVRLERVSGPPRPPVASAVGQVVGRLPRRAIAGGSPVRAEWLELPLEVERGDAVRVEVRRGGALLAIDAVAETAGRRGDRIALRNQESKKRFLARVAGKGRAVVEAPGGNGKENP